MTKKKFKSQAAYENHLNSKKYKQELAKFNQEKAKKAGSDMVSDATSTGKKEEKKAAS